MEAVVFVAVLCLDGLVSEVLYLGVLHPAAVSYGEDDGVSLFPAVGVVVARFEEDGEHVVDRLLEAVFLLQAFSA